MWGPVAPSVVPQVPAGLPVRLCPLGTPCWDLLSRKWGYLSLGTFRALGYLSLSSLILRLVSIRGLHKLKTSLDQFDGAPGRPGAPREGQGDPGEGTQGSLGAPWLSPGLGTPPWPGYPSLGAPGLQKRKNGIYFENFRFFRGKEYSRW